MAKKIKAGNGKEVLKRIVSVRFTNEQYAKVQEKASRQNMSTNQYIRIMATKGKLK